MNLVNVIIHAAGTGIARPAWIITVKTGQGQIAVRMVRKRAQETKRNSTCKF